jgi:hypothetical protein
MAHGAKCTEMSPKEHTPCRAPAVPEGGPGVRLCKVGREGGMRMTVGGAGGQRTEEEDAHAR